MLNNLNNKKSFDLNNLREEDILAISKNVLAAMKPGMTLQRAVGISDNALEEIYSLAYGFYDQGKYKEAESLFYFLAGAAPNNYKYVFGLASTYYQQKNYADAVKLFCLALYVDTTNPTAAYYVFDSLFKQDIVEEGREFLMIAIELCGELEEHEELKKKCLLIKDGLVGNKS